MPTLSGFIKNRTAFFIAAHSPGAVHFSIGCHAGRSGQSVLSAGGTASSFVQTNESSCLTYCCERRVSEECGTHSSDAFHFQARQWSHPKGIQGKGLAAASALAGANVHLPFAESRKAFNSNRSVASMVRIDRTVHGRHYQPRGGSRPMQSNTGVCQLLIAAAFS